ncbi:sperm microtubule associated protein 2 isoform X4 [Homo sapiens]|uniref:sperm microtubule associated protein 2 isoform X4 n=1 Tax=Homo sapiens TaxID=9606 RepID=UPI001FB14B3E|nr:sperm microtubule associated protein 2 isoform X4 [Homo sapiens]XP_054177147.1 sperm microtubule associated protein 2 isoform X4 [Homo sapiens]
MGDSRRRSLGNQPSSEAAGRSEREQDGDPRGLQSSVYESRRVTDPERQDLDNAELGPEDPEEELPPEEVAGEEFPETLDPKEALSELERVLDKDLEEDIPEISRLSISQKLPSTTMTKARKRRRRRRLMELAEPKINWQVLKDRTTPVWPIPRSSLEYRASSRLKELAAPKIRDNFWSMPMSEVSQVSRAAQMAVPSSRILQLSKPKAPATLLEEWDPVPKPKPHVSDHNRLLHLARPKAQSDKCVPDRDPRWEVLDVTKKVVASPRIISLAKPKVRKGLNEGYDRRPLASMSLPPPKASPEKCDQPRPGL